jgi:hypothetical protein
VISVVLPSTLSWASTAPTLLIGHREQVYSQRAERAPQPGLSQLGALISQVQAAAVTVRIRWR